MTARRGKRKKPPSSITYDQDGGGVKQWQGPGEEQCHTLLCIFIDMDARPLAVLRIMQPITLIRLAETSAAYRWYDNCMSTLLGE